MDKEQIVDAAVAQAFAETTAANGDAELSREVRIAVGVRAIVEALTAAQGKRPTVEECLVHASRLKISNRKQTVHQHWKRAFEQMTAERSPPEPNPDAANSDRRASLAAVHADVSSSLERALRRVEQDLAAEALAGERRHQVALGSLAAEASARNAALVAELEDRNVRLEAALAEVEEFADWVARLEDQLRILSSEHQTTQADLRAANARNVELATSERAAREETGSARRDAEVARARASELETRCESLEARLGSVQEERDGARLEHARLEARLAEVERTLEAERARADRQEETLRLSIGRMSGGTEPSATSRLDDIGVHEPGENRSGSPHQSSQTGPDRTVPNRTGPIRPTGMRPPEPASG